MEIKLKDIIDKVHKDGGFYLATADKGDMKLHAFDNADDFYEDERAKAFMEMDVGFISTHETTKKIAIVLLKPSDKKKGGE